MQLRTAVKMILVVAVMPALAQVPMGSVQGRVTCSDGNVPARGANVQLVPLAGLLPQSGEAKVTRGQDSESSTDFNGNYVISPVAAGTYIVDASKAGYSSDFQLVSAVLDRFTLDERKKLLANFPQVTVEAGSMAAENVVIHRGGAIMGRVSVDIGGVPAETSVTAAMVSSDLLGDVEGGGGGKPLNFVKEGRTDDRGVYRIAGLPAGTYRIGVRLNESYYHVFLSDGKIAVRPTRAGAGELTVFAPDALAESDGKLVKVGDGDEVADIDITIPMRLLHSISGTVTQGGAPLAGAADVTIFRQGKRVGTSEAMSLPDGSYRFDLLPAGSYAVKAQYPAGAQSSGRGASGKISVQVSDSDVPDANIDLPTTGQGK